MRRGKLCRPGVTSTTLLLIRDVEQLNETLDDLDLDKCLADFNRAMDSLANDAAQSLASVSSCFESIAKTILGDCSVAYPADENMQRLFAAALRCLALSPSEHTLPEIKRLCGGLLNVAAAVGVLRTQNSAAHGKGEGQQIASNAESRLAINALATLGIYLLEIAKERRGDVAGRSEAGDVKVVGKK